MGLSVYHPVYRPPAPIGSLLGFRPGPLVSDSESSRQSDPEEPPNGLSCIACAPSKRTPFPSQAALFSHLQEVHLRYAERSQQGWRLALGHRQKCVDIPSELIFKEGRGRGGYIPDRRILPEYLLPNIPYIPGYFEILCVFRMKFGLCQAHKHKTSLYSSNFNYANKFLMYKSHQIGSAMSSTWKTKIFPFSKLNSNHPDH